MDYLVTEVSSSSEFSFSVRADFRAICLEVDKELRGAFKNAVGDVIKFGTGYRVYTKGDALRVSLDLWHSDYGLSLELVYDKENGNNSQLSASYESGFTQDNLIEVRPMTSLNLGGVSNGLPTLSSCTFVNSFKEVSLESIFEAYDGGFLFKLEDPIESVSKFLTKRGKSLVDFETTNTGLWMFTDCCEKVMKTSKVARVSIPFKSDLLLEVELAPEVEVNYQLTRALQSIEFYTEVRAEGIFLVRRLTKGEVNTEYISQLLTSVGIYLEKEF